MKILTYTSILIVNGYASNANGQKRFDQFVTMVKDIFTKRKQSMVALPEMVIRDLATLDDYLYHPNSKYQSSEAQKMFDYVDMVFMDGDGNMLPWMRKCEKLRVLFKMCKLTGKCLFASGIGMQMLVNFCASNLTDMAVINERGGYILYQGGQCESNQKQPCIQIQEFVVDNRNTWDPHPVNITNINLVSTNYDTLAESERGPQIAIHANNLCTEQHREEEGHDHSV